MMGCGDFTELELDAILEAVESFSDYKLTGFASNLPSYINRVYELETVTKERIIAKFYRPGRWSADGIMQEHEFVLDCAADEIPVVAPLRLKNGNTLASFNGFNFALFPKKWGRPFEVKEDADWQRIGRIIARIHAAGARKDAPDRICMAPFDSCQDDVDYLLESGLVGRTHMKRFEDVCYRIIDRIGDLFEGMEFMRIHGDCHRGNILERPEEGIMIIDFDDMAFGPPIQDLWLLLPDYADNSKRELDLMLSGYCEFRDFDDASVKLIEPLRAMRIIYFLAWCARQYDDYQFSSRLPDWGNDAFWRKEINDLEAQYEIIERNLNDF